MINNLSERPVGNIFTFLQDISQRGLKCNYILDIGAHSCKWSRLSKKVFPSAVYYLVEPLIEMKDELEQFCIEFPESKYFLNAAGAKEENRFITVSNYLPEANLVITKDEYDNPEFKEREIKVITIDSLINKNEIQIPELAKLDVQGFELEVLKGAEKLFGLTEVFILEVSLFKFQRAMPSFADVINFMDARGYEVYDFSGFSRRPFDGALGQIDICFVKKNGLLKKSNDW